MAAPGWPARLADGPVGLRPLRLRDAPDWLALRRRNAAWLQPWEATPPGRLLPPEETLAVFLAMRRELHREARHGLALPFAVTYEERLVGQLAIRSIVRGAANTGSAGYWIDADVAGRGIMPTALALLVDHAFGPGRLHRIEANIRPENERSRRVVEKLGFRDEGVRRRYLHIDGAYRDHRCWAVTVEDAAGGMLNRWRHTVRNT